MCYFWWHVVGSERLILGYSRCWIIINDMRINKNTYGGFFCWFHDKNTERNADLRCGHADAWRISLSFKKSFHIVYYLNNFFIYLIDCTRFLSQNRMRKSEYFHIFY